jgi:hypothetical protein
MDGESSGPAPLTIGLTVAAGTFNHQTGGSRCRDDKADFAQTGKNKQEYGSCDCREVHPTKIALVERCCTGPSLEAARQRHARRC